MRFPFDRHHIRPSSDSQSRVASALLAVLLVCCACSKREVAIEQKQQDSLLKQGSDEDPNNTAAGGSSQSPTLVDAESVNAAEQLEHISGPAIIERIRRSSARFTLVNLWASWCGPCRREFPMLMSMRDNLQQQGLDILFISMDETESEAIALEFAQEQGLKQPIYVGQRPVSEIKAALHPEWPGMLPASFLYDQDGALKFFWGGPVFEHELLPVLEKALRGDEVEGEMRFGLSPGKDLRHQ